MRVLVHLESIPFRGSTNFIAGHLKVFIEPLLKALATSSKGEPLLLGVSTNIFLALKSLSMMRELSKEYIIQPVLLPIYSNKILQFYDHSVSQYCLDIYSRNKQIDSVAGLSCFFEGIFSEFNPNIVLTTSDNRYLVDQCNKLGVPLLSCEFGPLPRSLYPKNRFLNVGGHLNTELLSSKRYIKKQLAQFKSSQDLEGAQIYDFEEKYLACQRRQPDWDIAEQFFGQFKGKKIALLALQPRDWVTWEGALGGSLKPSEILRKALSRMQSDILVVTFHNDKSGDIPPQLFSEIWLSDRRLEKLPESLVSGSSELLLPFIDEVLSVSSNTSFTAFLLNKRITPISNSWVKVLSKLQQEFASDINQWRSGIYQLFVQKYFVEDSIFEDPSALSLKIRDLLKQKNFIWPPEPQDSSEGTTVFPYASYKPQTLAQIHDEIKYGLGKGDTTEFIIRKYGRNALGYLLAENTVGVELGVAGGYFSESLLRTGKFAKLFSVDRWSDHHNDKEYKNVVNRLSQFGDQSAVVRKTFDEAVKDFEDQSIDFIYIDAYAHKGNVAEIFAKWRSKLKPGAIVSGHDYCTRFWPENFKSINTLIGEADERGIQFAPGILNDNDEDVIPSFHFKFKPKKNYGSLLNRTLDCLWGDSDSQVKLLQKDGFLSPLKAADQDSSIFYAMYREISAQVNEIYQGQPHLIGSRIGNVVNVCYLTYDFLRSQSVLRHLTPVLGEDIVCWGSSYILKFPGSGAVSLHQDAPFWSTSCADTLTLWIALSSTDIRNGCMKFVKGSNHFGLIDHKNSAPEEGNVLNLTVERPTEYGKLFYNKLDYKQFSIHSELLIHGSGVNMSKTNIRECLIARFAPASMRGTGPFSKTGTIAKNAVVVSGKDVDSYWGNPERSNKTLASFDLIELLK